MAFQEQWERAVRWYERFRELNHGREHTMPSDNYQDEIYAFFQNCYHLKDWIKNDAAAPARMKQAVEGHISGSPALSLCADLCNASKHFTLNSAPRSGTVPTAGPRQFGLQLGGGANTLTMRVQIQSGGVP